MWCFSLPSFAPKKTHSGDSLRASHDPTINQRHILSENDSASSGLPQQEIWRKRLVAAELAFKEASVALAAALEEQARGSKELADVAAARERKTRSRLEYVRLLRIFSDLVLRGKLPG
jgi:hypothetical protein